MRVDLSIEIILREDLTSDDLVTAFDSFAKNLDFETNDKDTRFFSNIGIKLLIETNELEYVPFVGSKFFANIFKYNNSAPFIRLKGYNEYTNEIDPDIAQDCFQKEIMQYFTEKLKKDCQKTTCQNSYKIVSQF